MKKIVLKKEFFNQSAFKIAPELLGKFLVRKYRNREFSLMITEIEVYQGFKDKASHAYKGKTKRNKIMFYPAGHWYVYLTYGMHWMLNIVVDKEDYPAAILIRGTDKIYGPGRITKYLKINKNINGWPVEKKSGLWIEDRMVKLNRQKIKRKKRIGVDFAGQWAQKLYRYQIETN
jgi:DNA-3-methyladenine glycosylase